MNKLKFLLPALLLASLFTFPAFGQTSSTAVKKTVKVVAAVQTDTFRVLGNCGMCQRTIEQAARGAGADQAAWNVETDQLTVSFDPARTSVDAIQKAIAQAGYDNAGYKAPDAAYKSLHGCCQYDRSGAPGGAKACPGEAPKN